MMILGVHRTLIHSFRSYIYRIAAAMSIALAVNGFTPDALSIVTAIFGARLRRLISEGGGRGGVTSVEIRRCGSREIAVEIVERGVGGLVGPLKRGSEEGGSLDGFVAHRRRYGQRGRRGRR